MKKILIRILLVCLLLNVFPFGIFADNAINYEYVDSGADVDYYVQERVTENGNGLYTLEMYGKIWFDTRVFVKIVSTNSDVLYLGQVTLTPNVEFNSRFNFKNPLGEDVTVYRYFEFYKMTDADEAKTELIEELNGYKAVENITEIETFIKKYGYFLGIDMEAYEEASDKSVIISHIISEDVSTAEKFVSVVSGTMYLALYNSTSVKSDFVNSYKSILPEALREKYENISPDYIVYFNNYLENKPVSTKEMLETYLAEAVDYAVANEVLSEYNNAESKSEYISGSSVLLEIDLDAGFNKVTDYDMLDKILNAYDTVTKVEDIDTIKADISEAVVVQIINESEPADIFTYLDGHISAIRLTDKEKENYNDNKKDGAAIIKALKDGGFESAEDFIEALAKAVEPVISGGGSGGSSGGSSGGGFGGSSKPAPVIKNDETITVSKDIVETPDNLENTQNTEKFNDLETVGWAKTAINYLADRNIINGKNNGLFAPNDYVTREEFVKILVLAFNMELSYEDCGFDDVQTDQWYYPYICCAKKSNLIKGISDTEFGVGAQITRQDMAVMLYNAMKQKGMDMSIKRAYVAFDDEDNISLYATEAVKTLYEMGCINGMGEGEFSPKTTSSRAMAAQIIYKSIVN